MNSFFIAVYIYISAVFLILFQTETRCIKDYLHNVQ